jgi:uncharacterized integral membrane protein
LPTEKICEPPFERLFDKIVAIKPFQSKGELAMQIFLFFALFIAVLAVIFAIQNNDQTTVQFAVWRFEESLALILLITLAAGALISFFFSLPSNIKTRWTIRQQRKKLNELEGNLNHLRAQLDEAQKQPSPIPANEFPIPGTKPLPEPIPAEVEVIAETDMPEGEEPEG